MFHRVRGMLEVFETNGTFDRHKFIDCCRKFCNNGKANQYPGKKSILILDGASIHCDPNIIYYLRSRGLKIIFLPAYCPFFNPIEVVFGLLKSNMQRFYTEGCKLKDMQRLIARTMVKFKYRDMTKNFKKCGYETSGLFNPGVAFAQDIKQFGFEDTE